MAPTIRNEKYGYDLDPENHTRFLEDEDTCAVVNLLESAVYSGEFGESLGPVEVHIDGSIRIPVFDVPGTKELKIRVEAS